MGGTDGETAVVPQPQQQPSARVCPVCNLEIGSEALVRTREGATLHAVCFVCATCECALTAASYGVDLNGRFYCPAHLRSAQRPAADYTTLARGWLRKQGAVVPTWRKRYFVLALGSRELAYYEAPGARRRGAIDLAAVTAVQPAYLFVPHDRADPDAPSGSLPAFQLLTRDRVWNIACDTDSDRRAWLRAIDTARAAAACASPAASRGVAGTPSSPPPLSLPTISVTHATSAGSTSTTVAATATTMAVPAPPSDKSSPTLSQGHESAETCSAADDSDASGSAPASQSAAPTAASTTEVWSPVRAPQVQQQQRACAATCAAARAEPCSPLPWQAHVPHDLCSSTSSSSSSTGSTGTAFATATVTDAGARRDCACVLSASRFRAASAGALSKPPQLLAPAAAAAASAHASPRKAPAAPLPRTASRPTLVVIGAPGSPPSAAGTALDPALVHSTGSLPPLTLETSSASGLFDQ